MSKSTALLGIGIVSACLFAVSAEAKLIRYEIDGQSYSYSTNNIQQTKEARRRIEAAAAAGAAKTRAAAEAAGNPWVKIFGSPVQREAADAQARVKQLVMPAGQPDVASTGSVGLPEAQSRPPAMRAGARRQRARGEQQANLDRRDNVQSTRPYKRTSPSPTTPDVEPGQQAQSSPLTREQINPAPSMPAEISPMTPVPAESPRALAGDAGSLTDFVNQVRKAPP
jgi:hypothetical protein